MTRIYKKSETLMGKDGDSKDHLSFSNYIENIGNIVNTYCGSSKWVRCELVKINTSGGHSYLEITDTKEDGKKIKSQTAIIFQSNYFKIMKKFFGATGQKIKSGMELLVLIKPTLNPSFGLSFIIDDIDPNFTVGALEVKFNNIRSAIQERGWSDLNKSKSLPKHFHKVAVISPDGAAGLGDFKSDADKMSALNICQFDYYAAKFEGDGVEDSITETLKTIFYNNVEQYDALVFIRGGGSTSSLQTLNEFKIVAYLAKYPIPVIAGIGHERDKVLIDEYVKLSLDTPSKVASYIYNININNILRASENIKYINNSLISVLASKNDRVLSNNESIQQRSVYLIDNQHHIVNRNYEVIKNMSIRVFDDKLMNVNYNKNLINNGFIKFKSDKKVLINNYYSSIISGLGHTVDLSLSKVNSNYDFVYENSFERTLNKGYAIIKSSRGRLVSNIEDLSKLKSFTVVLKDGEYKVKNGE